MEQITPEQQAALDAMVGRYAREGARQQVEVVKAQVAEQSRQEVEAVKSQAAAEKAEAVRRAREEDKVEAAVAAKRAKEEAKAEQQRRKIAEAGLAVRSDDEVIHTRIAGDFRGWEGASVFNMENGQVWQQTDKESRFFPKIVNPEVKLTPSQLFGWKMELVKEGLWIRVKRVK